MPDVSGTATPAARRPRVFHRCSCGRPIPEGVMRCSSRTCPEFAPIWARDTRRRLPENLRLAGLTVMFSVTAPGAEVYPFDPQFCSHARGVKCSGRIGCRVNPESRCVQSEGGQMVERASPGRKGSGGSCDGP